ncbi:MAG: hypothetical protein II393_01840 [Cytophagales bacterium]|nr:hypothetical protein [Cytophagales bacterium]
MLRRKLLLLSILFRLNAFGCEVDEIKNDYTSKIYRFMIPVGVICEPKVLWGPTNKKDFLGAVKGGAEFFTTDFFKHKRLAFSNKHRIFCTKIIAKKFYANKKKDFSTVVYGYQFNSGISIILNSSLNDCYFNSKNTISDNIHTFSIMLGIKTEIGDINMKKDMSSTFPTKILIELLYNIDFKNGLAFYISITLNRCFSPVYLLSFNMENFKKVFNKSGNYPWNIDINIAFLGINITI